MRCSCRCSKSHGLRGYGDAHRNAIDASRDGRIEWAFRGGSQQIHPVRRALILFVVGIGCYNTILSGYMNLQTGVHNSTRQLYRLLGRSPRKSRK
jgi:hypothetical protein